MSIISTTVTATTTRQRLYDLLAATMGQTIQTGGITFPTAPTRAAQIILQSDPANTVASVVYVGGPTMTTTTGKAAALGPGASFTAGSASEVMASTSDLYILGSASLAVNVTLVD